MSKKQKAKTESDGAYVLKLILFILLGSLWLHIETGENSFGVPLPIGFVLGVLFARNEHFAIDRKIEYALLVVASFASFFLPIGLVVKI